MQRNKTKSTALSLKCQRHIVTEERTFKNSNCYTPKCAKWPKEFISLVHQQNSEVCVLILSGQFAAKATATKTHHELRAMHPEISKEQEGSWCPMETRFTTLQRV